MKTSNINFPKNIQKFFPFVVEIPEDINQTEFNELSYFFSMELIRQPKTRDPFRKNQAN